MTKERLLQVKLGGKTVQVPVYRDEKTTLLLVNDVNERLREIEEGSARVDTQAFALQAAYLFAADLARERAAFSEDDEEVIKSLTRVQLALNGLLGVLAKLA